MNEDLFDFSSPGNLELNQIEQVETFSIYSPSSLHENKYNHGIVLHPFKNILYAQWQSSFKDEDADDTIVLYSKSNDGKNWSLPDTLTSYWDSGIYTSGGWWSYEDTLIAYINVWPKNITPKGGYVIYKKSSDGINWSEPRKITTNDSNFVNGIIEQDFHVLPSGRILTAVHEQPGLICKPYFTDDPKGLVGWTRGKMENLSYKSGISRELEPSSFIREDGAIVMVFRDQASSFNQLASISYDNCNTWSKPEITNMPDSRAKQSAGNLQDGTAFIINNPSGRKSRVPLAITLSKDGVLFDKSFLIRGGEDLQSMKFQGKYKRIGYSYPKSVIWKNFLYVGYATNKEDIEISVIPLGSLSY